VPIPTFVLWFIEEAFEIRVDNQQIIWKEKVYWECRIDYTRTNCFVNAENGIVKIIFLRSSTRKKIRPDQREGLKK